MESQSTVEAVLLLTKLHVERHIEVDVNMEELDVTAAESKAAPVSAGEGSGNKGCAEIF